MWASRQPLRLIAKLFIYRYDPCIAQRIYCRLPNVYYRHTYKWVKLIVFTFDQFTNNFINVCVPPRHVYVDRLAGTNC